MNPESHLDALSQAFDSQLSGETNTESQDTGITEGVETEQPEVQPLQAPEHWGHPDREVFGRQPRDVQQWMLDRNKHLDTVFTQKTTKLAEERRQYERQLAYAQEAERVWSELANRYASRGLDSLGVQRAASAMFAQYANDPKGFIGQLAQQLGLIQAQADDEYADPQVKQLNQTVSQLQSQLQQQQQWREQVQAYAQQAQAYQHEQQQQAAVLNHWQQWAGEERGGKKLRPYADHPDVRFYMGALLQNQPDQYDLDTAYAAAVQKFGPVLQSQANKVQAAKRAATGVQGGGVSPGESRSIRDMLSRAYDNQTQRG